MAAQVAQRKLEVQLGVLTQLDPTKSVSQLLKDLLRNTLNDGKYLFSGVKSEVIVN